MRRRPHAHEPDRGPIRVQAAILVGAILLTACGGDNSGSARDRTADGALVYHVCIGCHGMDGRGVAGDIAPSLIDSPLVLADDPAPLIMLLLHGIENDGRWPGLMMPWRDALSDEQIAAVLSHIRSQWGHQAPPVTAGQVTGLREATSDRRQPYPRAELGIE